MLRSLSAAALAAALLVPMSAAPATAATSTARLKAAPISKGVWKSSATRRTTRPVAVTRVAPVPVRPTVAPTYESRVLAATNLERVRAGLRPLAPSGCAAGYAERWASRLSALGALSHQSMPTLLTGCAARGVGENVAFGSVSPEAMVAMWMASPGHRANILTASFTHLGVGALTRTSGRTYGVQVFLRL